MRPELFLLQERLGQTSEETRLSEVEETLTQPSVTIDYDPDGLIEVVTRVDNSATTVLTRNPSGQVTQVVNNDLGKTKTLAYNGSGQLTSVTVT